jgi:multidrug efflux pump subunit AcrA (membrane-fusion protein)
MSRRLRACLPPVIAALALSACSEVPSNLVESQPFKLEPIKGTDIQRVTLTAQTAENIDVQTARVSGTAKRLVVPHAALIYNPDGESFVYTQPERLTYVRAPVKVRDVAGDRVVLTVGPPSGTEVVTVGAAELLATEYEIGNQHP